MAMQGELEYASGQAFTSNEASYHCYASYGGSLVAALPFCSHIEQLLFMIIEFVPYILVFDRTSFTQKEPAAC